MKKIKFYQRIKPCVISTKDLAQLAKILYSIWEEDIKEAEGEWETQKLPELLKKIKEHNKKIKAKEPSYLFNTSLLIDDPTQIIEKEKKFFIYTAKGFYEWKSNFEIEFPGKTISASSPEVLIEELDGAELRHIKFEIVSTDNTRKIKVTLGDEYGDNFYEIEGEEETWVRGIKDKLKDIFTSKEVPKPFLHKGTFKSIASIILSILLLYTIYSFLTKLSLLSTMTGKPPFLWVTILMSLILFIGGIIQSYRALDGQFPYIQMGAQRKNTLELGGFLTILLGFVTNLIYDMFVWLFR